MLAEQSFGMFNTCIQRILLQLFLAKKKEGKKKKQDEQNQKFLCLVFLTLSKVSGTNRVDLALEYQREAVCKLFELLGFLSL